MKKIATLLMLLIVAIIYGVIGTLAYRQRTVSNSEVWDSDLLIFYLPALLALLVNMWIIGAAVPLGWRPRDKWGLTLALAVLAVLVAMVAYISIAFNTYGT